jgi:hypothetical protein
MKRFGIVLIALALLLTACQTAAENLTEQILEQAGDGDVDIDLDTGEVSLETDEGSVTIGGGELPSDFPIPIPDGYQVTSVFTADDAASVGLAYPAGDYDAIVAFFDDWTSSQSEEWSNSTSSISGEDGTIDSASWTQDDGGSFIALSSFCIVFDESIDPEDCVTVNITTGG